MSFVLSVALFDVMLCVKNHLFNYSGTTMLLPTTSFDTINSSLLAYKSKII
jgi:hypothetical protein